MRNKKQKIVIICGPTASGKTNLALQLAKELPKANVLSVDSRQVYQGLDIVTGKDIPHNLPQEIKIFGNDIFDPKNRANVGEFIRYSHQVIKDSLRSNTPIIIVGGTGLYLKAITQNLSDTQIPPNPKLRNKLEKLSLGELQDLLQKENPRKLSSLNRSDTMNPRRLIRYIEISLCHSGQVYPEQRRRDPESIQISPLSGIIFHWIGLLTDKTTLKTQIHDRVVQRLRAGALDEVRNLLKKYPDRNLSLYSSLGVSQIIDYLEKKLSEEQLVECWTNAETDYARRQTVWFKKQPGIVWYDKDIDKIKLIKELSKIYLKNA